MILTTAALCLALNVYHEARGETIPGQYAVALVTMNRAGGDPEKVCTVVLAKHQFSWTTGLVSDKKLHRAGEPTDEFAWWKAQRVAAMTLQGRMVDLTNGSTFYHALHVAPSWRHALVRTKKFGRHIFYARVAKSPVTNRENS